MGSSLVATRDTSTTIHVHDIISVLTGEDGEYEEDEGYVIIVFAHQSNQGIWLILGEDGESFAMVIIII